MFLVALAVLIGTALIVIPVWLAARLFGAKRRGLLACFFAALFSSLAFHLTTAYADGAGGALLGVAAMATVYMALLRMGFLSGLGVAVVVAVLQLLLGATLVVLLAGLLGTTAPAPGAGGWPGPDRGTVTL